MKKKIFKNRMFLIGIGFFASIVAIPTILTSCSSIDKSLVDKTFSKGNGSNFANNYSIADVAKQALKSDAGAKSMANNVASIMLLDWFDQLSKQPGQESTKRALDNQKKTIDDDYKNQLKTSSDSNGANHELKFQQDQLDPNGGTEESWKKKKMLEWAKSEFASKLFEKDYLAVVDSANPANATQTPTGDQIRKSVESNGYKFAFTENAIKNGNKNPYADKEYAKFQQFIFDQWVQIENPFIINMVLWKYGTPKEGINSIYSKDVTGITDKTSAGTYVFPYFAVDGTTNSNGGPITQFTNFVNNAKNNENYYSTNTIENGLGIRSIDKSYTTDSSTLIFAKNGSIYNDLYIEFAAASSYLFQQAYSTNTANSNLEKAITTTSTSGLDAITSNFVSATQTNNPSAIKIKSTLAQKFINQNGPLKTLSASDIYTIDAFRPNADSKLNDFLFIRDEAGVHAVAIEGQKYIKKATDATTAKKNAAQIVLFHYFWGKAKENSNGIEIDIKTELTNFFNTNTDYLISKYMEEVKDQKIFNPAILDLNLKYLYDAYSAYSLEISKLDRSKEYNEKMISQKQTYANNYGVDTKKNGFASGWIFNKTNNVYDVANVVNLNNNPIDPFSANGSYTKYLQRIDPYIDGLNLKPLTSSFGGFKYSQYIYSNDYLVNSVLLSYGSDSNIMGDSMKIDVLSKYLKSDFDLTTLKFKDNAFGGKTKTELDTALINNYYSSTFNSLTNKWSDYTETTFDLTKLNEYKFNLYKKTLNVKTNATITSTVSLLTLIATAKYLLANNGAELLNYLKTKISVGEDSYIGWINTFNSTLTTSPSNVTKVSDLLNSSNLQQNLNNSYNSVYLGMKNGTNNNTLIDLENNNTNSFISTNVNNYYSVVDNKVGFTGLINKDSTIDSVAIKNRLFVDPTIDNQTKKGVLYTYGSKADLLALIDSYSYESQISELTTDLMNRTHAFDAGQIFESATEINEKKNILKNIVNDTNKFTDVMFQRRDNYIGQTAGNNSDVTLVTDNTNGENIKSGAFVYQINNSDLKDWSSFENVFNNSASNKNDIIYNLLFTAAADTNLQSTALISILENNKLTIYDGRLNTQLGPTWITNWKN